ncbi:glycoside hydrolase family 13 protein [Rubrivivax albus]|uniref:Glycoside hydrolase family 13 protein n=1 Tax=Rubrivivax albus TaxID=2499835 RepID=A0A3S3SCC8_9BURK|nr:glycoside hydrolase family 13 protein [Rubrivivax albus]RVT51415.1 glycoside hydrolase family 13 protein [Rubrivivax albus]
MTTVYANAADHAVAGTYETREADWRMGAVVYQVLVDRFAPPADLAAKRHLYPAPKRLRGWDELPRQGEYLAAHKLWGHEIDFWGGDLQSLATRLDHVRSLHADVLYLNPICDAYTNHKYDALDYRGVSPEYGTRADVIALADTLHAQGMKLVLDGVFNHMGRNSPAFRAAEADPASPYRDWFCFDPALPGGARAWWRAENLPELNLENPAVRADLWGDADSVVRGWLRDGADGWRLDVAFDIGFVYLDELTRSAHAQKPGSLVVGEIPNWPAQWYPSVDGVMHFGLRQLLIRLAGGQLDATTFGCILERMLADCGIENLLRSWIYLDNHDTIRLATALPDPAARRLATVLQFTLPGSPNLYYGSEVDLEGGDDPEMRAPMPWDRVAAGQPTLDLIRRLGALRRSHRALRIGDWRPLIGQRLFAFERHTDRAGDSVLVVVNPTGDVVDEALVVTDSKLMDATPLVDLLGTLDGAPPSLRAALLHLRLPPKGVAVLGVDTAPQGGYTNYKRVQ